MDLQRVNALSDSAPEGATHIDHLGHYWKFRDGVWRVWAHGIGWRYDSSAPAKAELINQKESEA